MVNIKHNSTKHKLKQFNQSHLKSSDNVAQIGIVTRRSECWFSQNHKQVDQNGDNSNKDSQNESHRGQSNMVESVSIIRFAPHCCCVGAEMRTRWQCQPEPNAHDFIVYSLKCLSLVRFAIVLLCIIQVVIRWIMKRKFLNLGQNAVFSACCTHS